MKKWMGLLLSCALALNLAACGAGTDGGPEDTTPQGGALQITFADPLVKETEYTADDGTVLLTERYELPQLEVRTAGGEVYTQPDTVGNAPQEYRTVLTFNAEMQRAAEALDASAQEELETAREYYAGLTSEQRAYWMNYAAELNIDNIYQHNGLVSVWGDGYSYYGGAHPNFVTRAWNFDLTTGEFLTIDDLSLEEGDLNGFSVQQLAGYEMDRQIYEKNLNEGYFDDYGSYLLDFPSFATLCFTESGLTVTFDQYVIAPYAAGPQIFEVPYSAFYNALSDHAKELLDVSQEQRILANFDSAATLWAWFYMGDPPMDSNVTSEVDGSLYYLTDIDGVKTMKDLHALLCRYVTPELAGEWLDSAGQRYRDIDGRLYAMSAGRGSNESLGKDTRSVALDGDGGVLTQTVALLEWDDTAQTWTDTGKTESYEYPFMIKDGRAVFSAFPYPY